MPHRSQEQPDSFSLEDLVLELGLSAPPDFTVGCDGEIDFFETESLHDPQQWWSGVSDALQETTGDQGAELTDQEWQEWQKIKALFHYLNQHLNQYERLKNSQEAVSILATIVSVAAVLSTALGIYTSQLFTRFGPEHGIIIPVSLVLIMVAWGALQELWEKRSKIIQKELDIMEITANEELAPLQALSADRLLSLRQQKRQEEEYLRNKPEARVARHRAQALHQAGLSHEDE